MTLAPDHDRARQNGLFCGRLLRRRADRRHAHDDCRTSRSERQATVKLLENGPLCPTTASSCPTRISRRCSTVRSATSGKPGRSRTACRRSRSGRRATARCSSSMARSFSKRRTSSAPARTPGRASPTRSPSRKTDGRFEILPHYSKENGIVLWTCVRHAMLTQDKEWLRSIWPKLEKTVAFIKHLRQESYKDKSPLNDGLLPPGYVDGGINCVRSIRVLERLLESGRPEGDHPGRPLAGQKRRGGRSGRRNTTISTPRSARPPSAT